MTFELVCLPAFLSMAGAVAGTEKEALGHGLARGNQLHLCLVCDLKQTA